MSNDSVSRWEQWARFRFSVIGGLLASPPERGKLHEALEGLARRTYRHPIKEDACIQFAVSTIERWYYQALASADPIAALGRKVRSDVGRTKAMKPQLLAALSRQYKAHHSWSYQLHYDNLVALVAEQPELGPASSYSTVRRRMQERGWIKKRTKRRKKTKGQIQAIEHLETWEVRSYEASHVSALWHLDFHEGRHRIVDAQGVWHTPQLMEVLDDRSRLCGHIQWYLSETASSLIHGLSQAFAKRGLPRELMTDNGAAMVAYETRNGLERLGILHATTLAYSPYQNGKQETFWASVEGRLMAMLEGVESLRLPFLNRATQAWAEMEYNRKIHEELGVAPLQRFLQGPDVSRGAPDSQTLRILFTLQQRRTQRRSDGTITIAGVRFEIPSRLRHFRHLHVRYQRWDLSRATVVDERSGDPLATIYPQDKTRNADGRRRVLEPICCADQTVQAEDTSDPIPPLMRRLLAQYAATGLPPAYLPKEEIEETCDE